MGITTVSKKITKRNERAITDRQKRMAKKINDNLGISKGISSTTTRKNYHSKLLAGIFLNNFDNLKNGDCFYNKLSPSNYKPEDMLISIAGMEYEVDKWDKLIIQLHGISAELVGADSIEISYPRFNRGKDTHKYEIVNINDYFAKEIIKNYLIKNSIISDDYFQVLRMIIQNFHILYIEEIGRIGLEPRDTKQIREHIDYEELLLKEIEQGYVNPTIGDKRDKYKDGYTHILRNNLEMTLQQWQVRLLYDWKLWNFVIGARQIGKSIYKTSLVLVKDKGRIQAKDVKLGDYILGSNNDWTKIIGYENTKRKKCYKITLQNGMTQTVSYDHRVPTQFNFKNGDWDVNRTHELYSTAEELYKSFKVKRDRLDELKKLRKAGWTREERSEKESIENTLEMIPILNRVEKSIESTLTREQAMLYGYFLGDGCRGQNKISGNHDRLLLCTEYEVTSRKDKRANSYDYTVKSFKNSLNSSYLASVDCYSYEKYLAPKVFLESVENRFAVIEGLLNTDGYLGLNTSNSSYIEYCSTSERLIDDVMSLLLGLGIGCKKRSKKIKSNFNKHREFAYYIDISGNSFLSKLDSNIDLTNKKNYKEWLEAIREDKNQCSTLYTIPSISRNEITNTSRNNKKPIYNFQIDKIGTKYKGIDHWNNYLWCKIKDIEELGEEDIVSIKVEAEDELYYGDDILTHNTYTSAFIAYREFWRSDKGYAGRDRLTLYLSPTTEKQYAPKRYFEKMIAKDVTAGLIRSVSSRGLYVNKVTGAELKFISAEAKGGADSFFADSCIIDEGPMVPNEYWLNLLAILVQQKTNVFAIGTIDENSVKNWFYENSIKGELGDEKIQTIRVTIDDNELIADDARESMKKEYKPYPMLYWCKLYATFPSTGNVFNLRGVIQQMDTEYKQDTAIIGYDPAKNSDNPGLVVMDPYTFKVTQEHSLKGLDYREQYSYMKELKKTFNKAIIIMDRRGVGEAVFEIMEDIIDFSVYYTTTKQTKFDKATGRWSVQKKELVDSLALYMSIYGLTIDMTLTNLIKELKGFKKIIVGKSVLYEGVGITDDSVNALMLCVFYLSSIVKTKEPILKKTKSIGIDYEYQVGFHVDTGVKYNSSEKRMQEFLY